MYLEKEIQFFKPTMSAAINRKPFFLLCFNPFLFYFFLKKYLPYLNNPPGNNKSDKHHECMNGRDD